MARKVLTLHDICTLYTNETGFNMALQNTNGSMWEALAFWSNLTLFYFILISFVVKKILFEKS